MEILLHLFLCGLSKNTVHAERSCPHPTAEGHQRSLIKIMLDRRGLPPQYCTTLPSGQNLTRTGFGVLLKDDDMPPTSELFFDKRSRTTYLNTDGTVLALFPLQADLFRRICKQFMS